jgi:class 3 adenylate cyclase
MTVTDGQFPEPGSESASAPDEHGPIVPEPLATKRGGVAPLVHPARVLEGFRALFNTGDPPVSPAGECAESRPGTGIEPPQPHAPGVANHLTRTFAFVDVCGFTAYVAGHGTHAAIEILNEFRSVTRDVAARRGVRVAKWLGDGVMLVGTETGPTVAAAAELVARFEGSGIDIHVGLADGPVLLFEGDDYIGRPVNLASRLCDAAAPGEILAVVDLDRLPSWVVPDGRVTVRVAGVGDVSGVSQLAVTPDILEHLGEGNAA